MGPNPFVNPSRPLPLMGPGGNPFIIIIIIPRPPRNPRSIRPPLPRIFPPRPLRIHIAAYSDQNNQWEQLTVTRTTNESSLQWPEQPMRAAYSDQNNQWEQLTVTGTTNESSSLQWPEQPMRAAALVTWPTCSCCQLTSLSSPAPCRRPSGKQRRCSVKEACRSVHAWPLTRTEHITARPAGIAVVY